MAPLNNEICWRSGGFETGLAASYPANDVHDAVAIRRGDPKFVKSTRSNAMSQDAEMTTNPPTAASAQSHRAHNETTPMTTRQTHIYRLDIGHGINDTPPPRQTNAQHNGTAYIWHSTTQELLPILPPDHPDYRENSDYLLAAIRRWNGEAK